MHRNAARLAIRTLACAAVPMLLVAGCSSDSGEEDKAQPSPNTSSSAAPSPEPVKYTTLPDPCKTVSKATVKDVVPKARESGKNLGSKDKDGYGTCLWSGLDDFKYRALTVSLKRFDSDVTLGSGDKRASQYLEQQTSAIARDKENNGVKDAGLPDVGDEATSISFETKKKDGKKDPEDFREQRIVVRSSNVVVTVDYRGAGFESARTPDAKEIKENAEKAARNAVKSLK